MRTLGGPGNSFWHDFGLPRAQQTHCFTVLKFQGWCPGTIKTRQDATIMSTRGAEVPGAVFWHDTGVSNDCSPMGHVPR
eukprot:2454899-Pyramimonas_sp.AAC.1